MGAIRCLSRGEVKDRGQMLARMVLGLFIYGIESLIVYIHTAREGCLLPGALLCSFTRARLNIARGYCDVMPRRKYVRA